MTPPLKKKQRTGSVGEPSPSIEDSRELSVFAAAVPSMSPELIVQVASFVEVGEDLKAICVAAGPRVANIIRHEYLRKNNQYLHFVLYILFLSRTENHHTRRNKCRDMVRAWMEVNTKWRDICTTESIKMYKHARSSLVVQHLDTERHPKLIFNNPIVAVELGLVEVLQFLVQERNIRVNRLKWTGILFTDNEHLVSAALGTSGPQGFQTSPDVPCLEFLLSVQDIDLKRPSHKRPLDDNKSIFQVVLEDDSLSPLDMHCFRSIVSHRSIDLNNPVPILGMLALDCMIETCARREGRARRHVLREVWLAKLQILLDCGANPYQRNGQNMSPIDQVKLKLANKLNDRVWRDAIELMERPTRNVEA